MAAKVDIEECIGCGVCVEICPAQAIKIKKDKVVINDDCVECGACVNECPRGAISLP